MTLLPSQPLARPAAVRRPPLSLLLLPTAPACTKDPEKPPGDDSGVVDDGPDADGDGYGSRVDCDDTNPAIHPDADELCDGINNDCDAAIDEPDALDAAPWYRDADTDGFGDPTVRTLSCERPPGFIADSTDCDDTSSAAYPGAEEICNDGADNDCDADPTDCVLSGTLDLSGSDAEIAGAASGDAAGGALAVADLDGDGRDDLLVGAPSANDGSDSDSGAIYGVAAPLSGDIALGSGVRLVLYGGGRSENTGLAVASAGDTDRDGYDDLLVSAPGAEGPHLDSGEAYLLRGPLSGTLRLPGPAAATFLGEASYNRAGSALRGAGDVSGDGIPDLLVGAERFGSSETYQGAAYLLLGPHSGTVDLSAADARILGASRYDRVGATLGAGDFDGDGLGEPVIATWSYPENDGYGLVAIFQAAPSGEVVVSSADTLLTGGTEDGYFGQSVSAGDVDGDGHADLLVGAPYDTGAEPASGAAYLFLGPLDTSGLAADVADAILLGTSEDDEAGWSVACDGDFNGDGRADLLIGVPSDRTASTDAGRGALLYGPVAGSISLADADLTLLGARSRQEAGRAGTLAWDANGDGLQDVTLAAPQDSTTASTAGRVYVMLGVGL